MARLKKRKDGRYSTTITIDGKKHYLYGTTQRELEQKKINLKMEYEKNHLVKTCNMLFSVYADNWYHSFQENRNPNTREMYYNSIYKHIIPSLGHIPLNKITRSDIQKMIDERSNKPSTCDKIINTCRQLFEDALDDELIFKNPCRKVIKPKAFTKDTEPFSDKELAAIRDAVLKPMDRAFLDVLFAFGVRRGEALGLMVSDFDFANQSVRFERSITFDKNTPIINPFMKTSFSRRELYIPTPFVDSLKSYVDSCEGMYLFTLQSGDIMTKSSYDKMWRRISKAINDNLLSDTEKKMKQSPARRITALTFRHDFATKLYYSGISRKKAVEVMGHSGIQMIERVYAALDAKKENSEDKIDKMFDNFHDNYSSKKAL